MAQDDSELELVFDVDDEVDEDELVVVSLAFASELFVSEPSEVFDSDFSPELEEALRPFAEAEDDERESVMYQPLPLNTMPTGWMTLRNAPPQRSQVLSGGSEKL